MALVFDVRFRRMNAVIAWIFFIFVCHDCRTSYGQSVDDAKPAKESWITSNRDDRFQLLEWLIQRPEPNHAYAQQNGVDGFYNNPFQPELGAIDTALLRRNPAHYADGVFKPNSEGRPNPFNISDKLMKGVDSPGTTSKTGKTVLLVFFGQQLVEEVLDSRKSQCPPEYFNIPMPSNHPFRNVTGLDELPILRTRYDVATGNGPHNPRQQLNGVTPYLDGNLVYGTSSTWTDTLRHFANGTLAPKGQLAWSDPDGRFPEMNSVGLPMDNPPPPSLHKMLAGESRLLPSSRHFMLGNGRGNESPMLLSFGVLWFRWHNFIAKYLAKVHHQDRKWTDDRIFNEAKKWVIATYQHIVVDEWLPSWIGEDLPPYKGYDSSVNPQIDQLFQTAAMRFGHTLVPSGVYLRDYGRDGCRPVSFNRKAAVRTCNSYWRPQEVIAKTTGSRKNLDEMDIDRILMGMASQLSEREDHIVVEDLQGYVYGPLEFPRRDLMAINIQRGRDHGVADYNTARKSLGLDPIRSFASFVEQTGTTVQDHDPEVLERFAKLYENATIDNVDLWVGGLLETSLGPGPLFRAILKDQFSRIRSGDRFWYENHHNSLFTRAEVQRLKHLTLYDVIMAVTRMDIGDMQENPFLSPSSDIQGQQLSANCTNQMTASKNCIPFGPTNRTRLEQFVCLYLPQAGTSGAPLDTCTPGGSYSYFSGSGISFVTTVVVECVVVVVATSILMALLSWKRKQQESKNKTVWKDQVKRSIRSNPEWYSEFSGTEWMGHKDGTRLVNVLLNSNLKFIEVRDENTQLVRTIDLSRGQPFDLWLSSNGTVAAFKFPKEYDLVIKCEGKRQRNRLVDTWTTFVEKAGIAAQQRSRNPNNQMTEKNLLSTAVTQRMRRKCLRSFFRSVFSQAMNQFKSGAQSGVVGMEVTLTELSKQEFANELRMTPDSLFVDRMFGLIDKDNNGRISFHEFLDLLVILSHGTAEEKLQLLFNMYDTRQEGKMSMPEFVTMIRSLVELSSARIDDTQLSATVQNMISSITLQVPDEVTLAEFQQLMSSHQVTFGGMQLSFTGSNVPVELRNPSNDSRFAEARRTMMTIYGPAADHHSENVETDLGTETCPGRSPVTCPTESSPTVLSTHNSKGIRSCLEFWTRRLDYWRLEVFWFTLFTLFACSVFAERAYTYLYEREHVGLRQATGYGVPITRGAASGMMFSFSIVLLASCRHVVTWLRETPVHRFFPLDYVMTFHQYAACWGVFFAVVHTVGHGFNFYNIATQPASNLACLFREQMISSQALPKYHDWAYGTSTGVTGVLLWIQTVFVFFFSLPVVRRKLYLAFWFTHNLYPVFYILLLLHGAGRLVQEPHFPFYFIPAVVVYCIDLLISLNRRAVQVSILNAKILPSHVTQLVIQKPADFTFKSGQWVRISCPALGDSVYHPFTLSSAPQEGNLSLHIRAVGPWTRRLRETIQRCIHRGSPLPKVFINGPYGEGSQEWRRYPVAVLVGAGIGITPFASIMKDIATRISAKMDSHLPKKVYFLWVTRDQKQFEWFVDLIRQVESQDTKRLISCNIFVTQFPSKFDVRTVMLYVCERHFQKIENRSLFTGLRSVTHFGHPDFINILSNIGFLHQDVGKVGVFSCGPRSLVQSLDIACRRVNKEGIVDFRHLSEIY